MRTGRPRKFTDEERKQRRKEYEAKYYLKNKKKIEARNKKWRDKNIEKVKEYTRERELKAFKEFEEWKSTLSCSKCGENHVACLEFHHLEPSTKEKSISELRNSKKKRELELKKCIVLCSNCHKKLHYEGKKNTKSIPEKV